VNALARVLCGAGGGDDGEDERERERERERKRERKHKKKEERNNFVRSGRMLEGLRAHRRSCVAAALCASAVQVFH
jgi:hypothetical protein